MTAQRTVPAYQLRNAAAARAGLAARAAVRSAARLEDLEFLASTGVCRTEAAARAGFPSIGALRKFLYRQGRSDLLAALPMSGERAEAV